MPSMPFPKRRPPPAGLPPVPTCPEANPAGVVRCTEGTSFLPLVHNPSRPWKAAAFSWFPRATTEHPRIMGYSMRTASHRVTAWVSYNTSKGMTDWKMHDSRCGYELYDLRHDPLENENQARHPAYQAVLRSKVAQLQRGWRHARPSSGAAFWTTDESAFDSAGESTL